MIKSRINNISLTLLIVSTSFCYLTVYAQEKSEKTNEKVNVQSTQPQQVTIDGKAGLDSSRFQTAARTIISNEQLNRNGDVNILDAMRYVPGIVVSDGSMSISGMPAGYTQILVDGERPRGLSLSTVPMGLIDRVEVYRLGSAEFSSNAIGGTINIILKKRPSSAQQVIKFSLTNNFRPVSLFSWQNSDKQENSSYQVNFTALNDPGFTIGPILQILSIKDINSEQKILDVEKSKGLSQSLGLTPRFQKKMFNGGDFLSTSSFSFRRSDNLLESTRESLADDLPPESRRLIEHVETFSASTELKVKQEVFGTAKLEYSLGINSNYVDVDRLNALISTESDQTKGESSRKLWRKTNQTGVKSSGKLVVPSSTGSEISIGWTVSQNIANNKSSESYFDRSGAADKVEAEINKTKISNKAFFLQDEIQFWGKSSLYLGVRLEQLNLQNNANLSSSYSRGFQMFSPIIQTLWPLDKESKERLRFGISRGFKSPTVNQLGATRYHSYDNSIIQPDKKSNPNLLPESAWSMSSAYEHEGDDDVTYNVRATVRALKDVHQLVLKFDGQDWFQTTQNEGSAFSKLLEFDSSFPLKKIFESAPKVEVNFNVSKNWTSISNRPKPDNRLMPETLNLGLGLHYVAQKLPLRVGLDVRYSDNKWMQLDTNTRSFQTQIDEITLNAIWTLDKRTKLNVNFSNPFKKKVRHIIENKESQRETIVDSLMPTYRQIRLTLEYQLPK